MSDQAVSEQSRDQHKFVLLADAFPEAFDLGRALERLTHCCVDLFGASSAGVVLGRTGDPLEVLASSDENCLLLDGFQLRNRSGPSLEAYATGGPVAVGDLDAASHRWPGFVPRAGELGFRSVHVFPMRFRADIIGVVNLYYASPTELVAGDRRTAQTLADMTAISVLQLHRLRDREMVAQQLQRALNSRIVIEQAKGMLAEMGDLGMARAFDALRRDARDNNLRLTEVAGQIVARELDGRTVLQHAHPRN